MEAIIYKSNTGFTEEYAKLLGDALTLPVYTLPEAKKTLKKGSEVICLGWLMAGKVNGYKNTIKNYSVPVVVGVGMGSAGGQIDDVRKSNAISPDIQVFTLCGGFDINKLHGIYKFMMKTMRASVGKSLSEKPDKTPEEEEMLDLLLNGGSRVDPTSLEPIIKWYNETQMNK